jgi:hypothetical protein
MLKSLSTRQPLHPAPLGWTSCHFRGIALIGTCIEREPVLIEIWSFCQNLKKNRTRRHAVIAANSWQPLLWKYSKSLLMKIFVA